LDLKYTSNSSNTPSICRFDEREKQKLKTHISKAKEVKLGCGYAEGHSLSVLENVEEAVRKK